MAAPPSPLPTTVWVRIDCLRYHDRGPYHWTRECVDGRVLIPIARALAGEMSNLRPCKICTARHRRGRGEAPTRPVRSDSSGLRPAR